MNDSSILPLVLVDRRILFDFVQLSPKATT